MMIKKKSMQGDEWEKPVAYPGAMWEEDQTNDIRMLEVGDVKSIGLEITGRPRSRSKIFVLVFALVLLFISETAVGTRLISS